MSKKIESRVLGRFYDSAYTAIEFGEYSDDDTVLTRRVYPVYGRTIVTPWRHNKIYYTSGGSAYVNKYRTRIYLQDVIRQ